jgi:hypothetical protein
VTSKSQIEIRWSLRVTGIALGSVFAWLSGYSLEELSRQLSAGPDMAFCSRIDYQMPILQALSKVRKPPTMLGRVHRAPLPQSTHLFPHPRRPIHGCHMQAAADVDLKLQYLKEMKKQNHQQIQARGKVKKSKARSQKLEIRKILSLSSSYICR